jgi:4'-phosphopantetheinyl transferase
MIPAMLERIPLDLSPLAETTAEIWLAHLNSGTNQLADCVQLLSIDEQARASRFHAEDDRRRFIVSRGTLRLLLGERLDCKPAAIEFQYSAKGKPTLSGTPLHFNVSHSHECALYGFSETHNIGVDIEYLERDVDHAGLAQRFLSLCERAALQDIPEGKRKHAFLAYWTGKEAIAKATGEGLAQTLGLEQIELMPTLADSPSRHIAGHQLYTIAINQQYVASVAIKA